MNWHELQRLSTPMVMVAAVHYKRIVMDPTGMAVYDAVIAGEPTPTTDPLGLVSDALERVRELHGVEPDYVRLYAGELDHVHVFDKRGFYKRSESYFTDAVKLAVNVALDERKKPIDTPEAARAAGRLSADAWYDLCGGDLKYGNEKWSVLEHMLAHGYEIGREQYLISNREVCEQFAAAFRERMQDRLHKPRVSENPTVTMRAVGRC